MPPRHPPRASPCLTTQACECRCCGAAGPEQSLKRLSEEHTLVLEQARAFARTPKAQTARRKPAETGEVFMVIYDSCEESSKQDAAPYGEVIHMVRKGGTGHADIAAEHNCLGAMLRTRQLRESRLQIYYFLIQVTQKANCCSRDENFTFA